MSTKKFAQIFCFSPHPFQEECYGTYVMLMFVICVDHDELKAHTLPNDEKVKDVDGGDLVTRSFEWLK
jgi:hypothetical protein